MTTTPPTVRGVRNKLVERGAPPTPTAVARAAAATGQVLSAGSIVEVVAQLRQELIGFGPLERWLREPNVSDVLVNGPNETWVDRGDGLQAVDATFADEDTLRHLVQRLASHAGRRIDDAHPFVDAKLPGGIRMHAVLPPVSDRLCLSLRTGRRNPFTLTDLTANGTVTPEVARYLTEMVASRRAFLISGGTGSGKTTILACLLSLVEPTSRIVIVEDTTELRPNHPHVVSLETRPANIEGAGTITLSTLVRQALRMRPDRLVVGEARGEEMVDLLAAMNTGHEGGCATLHANRPTDVPARVEALFASAGLTREAAHSQLVSALDTVIHVARRSNGSRYIESIAELSRDEGGLVAMNSIWQTPDRGTKP